MIWVGQCNRCGVVVNERPGLAYADYRGRFGFCRPCLKTIEIGDGHPKKINGVWKSIWLEDVLPECILKSDVSWYLGNAEENWFKIKDNDCSKCSPYELKNDLCHHKG
jgi:hypothetical protein